MHQINNIRIETDSVHNQQHLITQEKKQKKTHTHTQGNQKAKVWGNNAIQTNYKSKFFAGWTMHALNGAA